MPDLENVKSLVEEYRTIADSAKDMTDESLEETLVREGDWTPQGAAHLVMLSKQYGSFMLRNALALSIALGFEDGELGL